jgi:hypothetical protein
VHCKGSWTWQPSHNSSGRDGQIQSKCRAFLDRQSISYVRTGGEKCSGNSDNFAQTYTHAHTQILQNHTLTHTHTSWRRVIEPIYRHPTHFDMCWSSPHGLFSDRASVITSINQKLWIHRMHFPSRSELLCIHCKWNIISKRFTKLATDMIYDNTHAALRWTAGDNG